MGLGPVLRVQGLGLGPVLRVQGFRAFNGFWVLGFWGSGVGAWVWQTSTAKKSWEVARHVTSALVGVASSYKYSYRMHNPGYRAPRSFLRVSGLF